MLLTEKYSDQISGILHCYDRIVIQGTVPGICYAQGMTSYLNFKNIRIFDYPKFAEPYKNEIRNNAEKIAETNGLKIDFLRKRHIRKESIIKKILDQRGDHPGLVHIFSAMEACPSYKPWHNKKTGKTYLKSVSGKCLHYYFYLIDAQLKTMLCQGTHLVPLSIANILQWAQSIGIPSQREEHWISFDGQCHYQNRFF